MLKITIYHTAYYIFYAIFASNLLFNLIFNFMDSEIYVIYDQFHWLSKFHLEVPASGYDNALALYRFYRSVYPKQSFGLKTLIEFKKLKSSYTYD